MKIKKKKKQINWMKLDWLLIMQWQKILHIYYYLTAATYRKIFEGTILNRKASKEKLSI